MGMGCHNIEAETMEASGKNGLEERDHIWSGD